MFRAPLTGFAAVVKIVTSQVLRRGGRAVEGARLESVCTLTGTKGSNPFLSAINNDAPLAGASFFIPFE